MISSDFKVSHYGDTFKFYELAEKKNIGIYQKDFLNYEKDEKAKFLNAIPSYLKIDVSSSNLIQFWRNWSLLKQNNLISNFKSKCKLNHSKIPSWRLNRNKC